MSVVQYIIKPSKFVCNLHQFYLTSVHLMSQGHKWLVSKAGWASSNAAPSRCPVAPSILPEPRLNEIDANPNQMDQHCIEPPTYTINTWGCLYFSFVSSVWKETSICKRKIMEGNKHEHGNETSNVLDSMMKNKGSFMR